MPAGEWCTPPVGSPDQAPSRQVAMENYTVDGVSVDHLGPPDRAAGKPPLIFVHGGNHTSSCWNNYLSFFASHGWDCHALNWFNHGASRRLSEYEFTHRSIADVATEIATVQSSLGTPAIVVGHSMGGLATLQYAATATASPVKVVLMSPTPLAQAQLPTMEVPVDENQPWGPGDFEMCRQLFYPTMDETTARTHYADLVAESPRAIFEATRHTLDVDLSRVTAPAYVMATEFDVTTPVAGSEWLAAKLNAPYALIAGAGHCEVFLQSPHWHKAADQIEQWLND